MLTPSLTGRGLYFDPSELEMPEQTSIYHQPVLLEQVRAAARGARRVVDATLGDGGHAAAFRSDGAEVLGIDRDPAAIALSRQRLGTAGMQYLLAPYASPEARGAAQGFGPDFISLF